MHTSDASSSPNPHHPIPNNNMNTENDSSDGYYARPARSLTTAEKNASSHPDYDASSRAETVAASTQVARAHRLTHTPTMFNTGQTVDKQILPTSPPSATPTTTPSTTTTSRSPQPPANNPTNPATGPSHRQRAPDVDGIRLACSLGTKPAGGQLVSF